MLGRDKLELVWVVFNLVLLMAISVEKLYFDIPGVQLDFQLYSNERSAKFSAY